MKNDFLLDYVGVYIQVKNPFELYRGGLDSAVKNFDEAYKFAVEYPFCSLADYAGNRNLPIIDKDFLKVAPGEYKMMARDFMKDRLEFLNEKEEKRFGQLMID